MVVVMVLGVLLGGLTRAGTYNMIVVPESLTKATASLTEQLIAGVHYHYRNDYKPRNDNYHHHINNNTVHT